MAGKFISYLRVSTDKQGQSGLGIEAQRKAVDDYLNGGSWQLLREYVEIETGKRNDRPQLAAALAHAKATGATVVIAKWDRLARNVAFTAALLESGVEFVACDNPHATRFTIHILAAVAGHEGAMISIRTRAALAATKARNQKLGHPNGPPRSAAVAPNASFETTPLNCRVVPISRPARLYSERISSRQPWRMSCERPVTQGTG
jgi:DNA invertase Pin-like site-specific DNA recombinase